jgi:hypothetical protein
MKNFV